MIQTHSQLRLICDQYNSFFSENELCLLQKAYTTPHFLTLSIRFPGKTVVLYLGRGNQYQGIYLDEKLPPSFLRIQDRFLDYVRKNLVNKKLSKIKYHPEKMLISFEFKKDGISKTFYLGWHERQLYFDQKPLDETIAFIAPSELLHDRKNLGLIGYFTSKNFETSKSLVQKKKEKFLLKKIQNITNDISKNQNWHFVEDELNNGRINFDASEVIILNEKIKFKNCKNEWQKKDQVFKKIKKLKKGEEILKARLVETELEIARVKAGQVEYIQTKEAAIQPRWPNQLKKPDKNSSSTNIKEITLGQLRGTVGLDASGNDQIRNGLKKDFYWFHLENYKSAHCIIKIDDINQLSHVQISAIASLLRDLSHLDIFEIPLLFTQLKNIKGVKGSAGKVIVSKGKHLRCTYGSWTEIISIS